MSVIVEISRFSGPLDLLLYLIKKEEMDIFDINIQEITKQYLDSVRQMKKLNLEMAGDFVAMAATLIQIKAKMLVPQYNESGEPVLDEDPRKDLVRRLLEYQMYKEAGKDLYNRNLVGRDVYLRGDRESIETPDSEIVIEEDNSLFALISNYRLALQRVKKAIHTVAASMKSVKDRIWELRDRLRPGHQVAFSGLIASDVDRRGELLITFLSILELAKMGFVSLFQGDNFSEIHIEAKREINEGVMENVESYEANNNPGAVLDVWITEEDQAEATRAEEAMPVAATDEEILNEERKYEQEI